MHVTLKASLIKLEKTVFTICKDVWRIIKFAFDQSKGVSKIQHVHVLNVSLTFFAAKVADMIVLPFATYRIGHFKRGMNEGRERHASVTFS